MSDNDYSDSDVENSDIEGDSEDDQEMVLPEGVELSDIEGEKEGSDAEEDEEEEDDDEEPEEDVKQAIYSKDDSPDVSSFVTKDKLNLNNRRKFSYKAIQTNKAALETSWDYYTLIKVIAVAYNDVVKGMNFTDLEEQINEEQKMPVTEYWEKFKKNEVWTPIKAVMDALFSKKLPYMLTLQSGAMIPVNELTGLSYQLRHMLSVNNSKFWFPDDLVKKYINLFDVNLRVRVEGMDDSDVTDDPLTEEYRDLLLNFMDSLVEE